MKITRRILTATIACAVAVPVSIAVTPRTAVAQSGHKAMSVSTPSAAANPIALDGYCPVCVVMLKKWEKGSPEFASQFDGRTYLFPGKDIKAKFDAAPEKFVPALGGDCIVCLEKMGKRVPGSIKHASLHNNRLFLFPSEKEKQMFEANADAFVNTDLAINGECVVCLAKFGKHVPGSTEFTVIHNGRRYLFPSNKEADVFRQSPAKFVQEVATMNKTGMAKPAANAVRLVGRSGCAGCEHGVKPLGAPDELGFAINTADGKVIVIEDAHTLYPKAYKARFGGDQYAVEGEIVKTQGKVSWLKPSKLVSVN